MPALVDAVNDEDGERIVAPLRGGADPNETDEHGMSALGAAVGNGDLEVVERLIAACADSNHGSPAPLVYAAWASGSSAAMLERLLRAGAEVDRADDSGSTALYMAAVGGSP